METSSMPDSLRKFISKTDPIEEEPAERIAQRIEVPKGIGRAFAL